MSRHGTLYTKWIQSKDWYAGLRLRVLRDQRGLCAWCKAKGYIVPATVVHHLVEVESGTTESEQKRLMFSRSNCVGLCRKCHSDYHNGHGYHSSNAVKQRQQERQAAWKNSMLNRFKDPNDFCAGSP